MADLPVYKNTSLLRGVNAARRDTDVFAKMNDASTSPNDGRAQAPMIDVSNLTKRYAGRAAVRNISFTVARGEIVGLLGPNGAGKSTTMRILSGFMPATSGT